jgi:hypothetical protein
MNRKFVSSTIQSITLLIAATRTGIAPSPSRRLSPTPVTNATALRGSNPKDMQANDTCVRGADTSLASPHDILRPSPLNSAVGTSATPTCSARLAWPQTRPGVVGLGGSPAHYSRRPLVGGRQVPTLEGFCFRKGLPGSVDCRRITLGRNSPGPATQQASHAQRAVESAGTHFLRCLCRVVGWCRGGGHGEP